METGVLLLGAFKLDQLQQFKLILFQTFSTCLAFILGAHISYYPIYRKAENLKEFLKSEWDTNNIPPDGAFTNWLLVSGQPACTGSSLSCSRWLQSACLPRRLVSTHRARDESMIESEFCLIASWSLIDVTTDEVTTNLTRCFICHEW